MFPRSLPEIYVASDNPERVFELKKSAVVMTDGLEYKIPSFTIETDGRGFRNVHMGRKSCHIACLGDSNTFGWGVQYEETFCSLLRGEDISTYNYGVPGYNAQQLLSVLIDDIVPDAPDIIIYAYDPNDREYPSILPKSDDLQRFLLTHSLTYRLGAMMLLKTELNRGYDTENFVLLIDSLRSLKIPVYVIKLYEDDIDFMGLETYDLLSEGIDLESAPYVIGKDNHPNNMGHHAISELLKSKVVEQCD
jgi:hypothetical protein